MAWLIGRTAALSDPEGARRKAAAKLRDLVEVDDPESVVFPIEKTTTAPGGTSC